MSLSLVTAPATEPLTIAEVKTHLKLGDSDGEPAPPVQTLTLVALAGNVTAGAHRVLWTFVTADGETDAGGLSAAVTADAGHGQIDSTVPIGGSAVTARRGYMTIAGGSTYLLVTTIADNTTTTYRINTADGSLGAQAPTVNTTADPELTGFLVAAREYGETFTHRQFITATWDDKRPGFPCADVIELPLAPLVSVTSVSYVDTNGVTQTWSASLYTVDAPVGPKARFGRIVPNYGQVFPSTRDVVNAVTIRFVAGYGAASAVPTLVKACLKEHIRASWLRGDAKESQKILEWVHTQLWGYKAF